MSTCAGGHAASYGVTVAWRHHNQSQSVTYDERDDTVCNNLHMARERTADPYPVCKLQNQSLGRGSGQTSAGDKKPYLTPYYVPKAHDKLNNMVAITRFGMPSTGSNWWSADLDSRMEDIAPTCRTTSARRPDLGAANQRHRPMRAIVCDDSGKVIFPLVI